MGEGLHRAVVAIMFLVTVVSLVVTYIGIDAYIESGRSVMGDARTTVKFQWKSASCDDLAASIGSNQLSDDIKTKVNGACTLAKDHLLPPIAIKTLIDSRKPKVAKGENVKVLDEKAALDLIKDVSQELLDTMPKLERRYANYRQEIKGMWFFFLFVIGAGASYFYAKAFTPVLFDRIKGRFEKIMFGKNKYFANWDKFMKQNKPE